MTVIAIDPGSAESAWVLWDGHAILGKGKAPNESVGDLVGHVATQNSSVRSIAIEQIVGSYGGNAGMEVMETAYWSGRFAQRWATHRGAASVIMLPRKTVVTYICGQAKANDSNVRCALIDRVGSPGTKKLPGPTAGVTKDIWAALAVAVTAYDRLSLDRL